MQRATASGGLAKGRHRCRRSVPRRRRRRRCRAARPPCRVCRRRSAPDAAACPAAHRRARTRTQFLHRRQRFQTVAQRIADALVERADEMACAVAEARYRRNRRAAADPSRDCARHSVGVEEKPFGAWRRRRRGLVHRREGRCAIVPRPQEERVAQPAMRRGAGIGPDDRIKAAWHDMRIVDHGEAGLGRRRKRSNGRRRRQLTTPIPLLTMPAQ